MTPKSVRFLLAIALIMGVGAPAQVMSEAPPYPIKDSGMPAFQETAIHWLGSDHLIFWGFKVGPGPRIKPDKQWNRIEQGYYVWDLKGQTVTRDTSFDGVARLCVHNRYWSYLRPRLGTEKSWDLMEGERGGEGSRPFPKKYWFNPFSCRYYDTPPAWVIQGRETAPLLEEHGYLDWGPSLGTSEPDEYRKNTPIAFHPQGAQESINLPIGRQQAWRPDISYAAFKGAYLIPSLRYRDPATGVVEHVVGPWPDGKPYPVWLLTPEGQITELKLPFHRLMRGGSRQFYLTQAGVVVVFHGSGGKKPYPGEAGGYLFHDEKITKLIPGLVRNPAISPDGCRIAFIHDPYDTESMKDRFDRITVKMIDLCQGGAHAGPH